jgi:hypothetical protein
MGKQKKFLPLQTIFLSAPSLPTDGIFMRRADTIMKAVPWGTASFTATPQWRMKEWYTKNPRMMQKNCPQPFEVVYRSASL